MRTRDQQSRSRQRGFTLLEAIVALVLIASAGIALYGWINANLISLSRVQAIRQRDAAIRNALAFMDTVNPMQTPQGKQVIGPYSLEWVAALLKPAVDGVGRTGGQSLFQVGLYETQVKVTDQNATSFEFSIRQVGYVQVRQLDLGF